MKQTILVRTDIKMSVGKKIAQACHACVGAVMDANKKAVDAWNSAGAKKIVLAVNDGKRLTELYKGAKKLGLPCFLVADAGLTELEPGTITALAIGPADDKRIDKLTGNIKLL
ncbi:MAG: peptidyl-tRNA hydrolase Pth2 [Candidatus Aenigmatarchaeota archaeon]